MRRISDLKSWRWRDGDGLHKRMMELLGVTANRGLDSKGNSSLAPLALVDYLATHRMTATRQAATASNGVFVKGMARWVENGGAGDETRRWREGGNLHVRFSHSTNGVWTEAA